MQDQLSVGMVTNGGQYDVQYTWLQLGDGIPEIGASCPHYFYEHIGESHGFVDMVTQ